MEVAAGAGAALKNRSGGAGRCEAVLQKKKKLRAQRVARKKEITLVSPQATVGGQRLRVGV